MIIIINMIMIVAGNAVGKRDQWNYRLWTRQEERWTQIIIIVIIMNIITMNIITMNMTMIMIIR